MPKFKIIMWVTETRKREVDIDAASRDEAEKIARIAIQNAIDSDRHHMWKAYSTELDFDVYGPINEKGNDND